MSGAIVTGTDGSESATAAMRQAAELVASSGVALHVVSGYGARDGGPSDAVRAILDGTREALSGVEVELHTHAEPGDPAAAIRTVAARIGAGLIVVGNKGWTRARAGRGRRSPIRCDAARPATCSSSTPSPTGMR